MSPLDVVRNAGLAVSLSEDGSGTITVSGAQELIDRWRPFLREHKAAIQAELLAEHARDLEAALACVIPRDQAQAEAMAATGLLARNTRCPWAALRLALQDESLPNAPDPVDRPPYGLPTWCLAPKTGKPIRQGRFSQPQP
jgi:hypothetical protein